MVVALSKHLLNTAPSALHAAIQHPFLEQAANSSLPQELLVQWLAQDRLYALSYVTFIGQLLAKTSIPSTANRVSTLKWRIASCLIDCLTNIRRELEMFENVAKEHGWMEILGSARPSTQTQAYKDLFAGAGQPTASLLKGMVTLWATEKCYLLAWSYGASQVPAINGRDGKSKDVMQSIFIPNWSSREFQEFVKILEELVDEMGEIASKEELIEAEETWRQVVWAEEAFWPNVMEKQYLHK